MTKKRIVVTQADIDAGCYAYETNGRVASGGNCPVFRAAERAFPDVNGLWVTRNAIYATALPYRVIAGLPDRAQLRITHFDHTGEMEPFQFTVEVEA